MQQIRLKIVIFTLLSLCGSGQIYSQTPTLFYKVVLLRISEKDSLANPPDTVNVQRIAVTLADSAIYVSRKNQRRVYDFAKEKIYFLNTQAKNYDEAPLFAEIDFRRLEFFNRLRLKNMLNRDGIENQVGTHFELESLFGISRSDPEKPANLIELSKENILEYALHSRPVASFIFSEIPLETRADIFARYLLYETQLHPAISRALVSQNKVPERMEFAFNNSGKRYKAVYFLEEYRKNTNLSEFGHQYYLYAYQSNNDLKTRINQIYGYIHSNDVVFPRKETIIQNFKQSLEKRRYIEAFLILTESNLASDENYDNEFALLKTRADDNKRFQDFLSALLPSQNPDDLTNKIRYLEKLRKSIRHTKKAYLLDAFIASYYNGLGENDKALQLFDNVIAQNPYITSIYMDIGNIYTEQYNMRMAWKCFEIVQHLYPSHPVNAEVRLRKKHLKETYPHFFMHP